MPKGKRFPPEFRTEAVRLYRMSGRTQVAVARELGVSSKTLGNWIRQAEIEEGEPVLPLGGTPQHDNGGTSETKIEKPGA